MNEPDLDFLQDLDIGQKRSLVCRALMRLREEVIDDAKVLLGTRAYLHLIAMCSHPFFSRDDRDDTSSPLATPIVLHRRTAIFPTRSQPALRVALPIVDDFRDGEQHLPNRKEPG